jgi:hypothetical protein
MSPLEVSGFLIISLGIILAISWLISSRGENNQPRSDGRDSIARAHDNQSSYVVFSSSSASETHSSTVGNPAANRDDQPAEGPFQKIIAVFTVVLGIAAIMTNFQTCHALRDSRDSFAQSQIQSRQQFEAAQRPYVGIGTPEGKIAEYRPSTKANEKGSLIVEVYNAGASTATNLIVNMWTSLSPEPSEEALNHIERWVMTTDGRPSGEVVYTGTPLPGHAVSEQPVPSEWVPTDAQFEDFKQGKALPAVGFEIVGTIEYCDPFGHWRCQAFTMKYQPLPLNRFVNSRTPDYRCSYIPSTAASAKQKFGITVIPLSRCEKPGEQQIFQAEDQP